MISPICIYAWLKIVHSVYVSLRFLTYTWQEALRFVSDILKLLYTCLQLIMKYLP